MIAGLSRRGTGATTIVATVLSLSFFAGCADPAPQRMSMQQESQFRIQSIRYLEDVAFSDDPSGRMQAIEAFAKAAPAQGVQLQAIPLNIENEYPGASFAALVAAAEIGATQYMELARTRAEHPNPHVRMAAIFAMHKFGDRSRTGEIGQLLQKSNEAKVRANAALLVGKIGGKSQLRLLRSALRREKKDLPKLQILESLATLGDESAIQRLIFEGYSEKPQQCAVAVMMLANARSQSAEDLFWLRLRPNTWPEIQLQAVRGLARIGRNEGEPVAVNQLFFTDAKQDLPKDPPEQQISRVRGLAALALEDIADPMTLPPLQQAFNQEGQSMYTRIAIARAALTIIHRLHPDWAEQPIPIRKPAAPQQLAGDQRGETP